MLIFATRLLAIVTFVYLFPSRAGNVTRGDAGTVSGDVHPDSGSGHPWTDPTHRETPVSATHIRWTWPRGRGAKTQRGKTHNESSGVYHAFHMHRTLITQSFTGATIRC